MKKIAFCAWTAVAGLAASAITVDGRLDESEWASAEWHGGFTGVATTGKDQVKNQTEFALIHGEKALYVGVRCHESLMEKLKAAEPKSIWTTDAVDLFLSPAGTSAEFYHFAVAARKDLAAAIYNEEAGNIEPDPYRPDWKHAAWLGDDMWTIEIELPYTAFYMTRNAVWKDTWRINVCRKRVIGKKERSSWKPLARTFMEPARMGSLGGFRKRPAAADLSVVRAAAAIKRLNGSKPAGTFSCRAYAGEAGDYEFAALGVKPQTCHLKSGWNDLKFDCEYEKSGFFTAPISLKRGELTFRREHPLSIVFEPIALDLEKPGYRNNFYPGQDASVICGTVKSLSGAPVEVSISGDGIPSASVTTGADGAFSFATPGFAVGGEATLTFKGADGEKTVRVRNLKPTGHRMSWIEDGHIVIDGKPVLTRRVGHHGYHGGKWMDEIFKRGLNFPESHEMREVGLEPMRLVKGIEQREAKKNVYPCDELFAAIDKVIENHREKDFSSYYICDEPECRQISPVYLKYIYDYVREKDPYHIVRTGTRAPLKYLETADLFETHPYINPHNEPDGRRTYSRPINEIGDFVECVSSLNRRDKAIGFYQTSFSYRYLDPTSDYPTFPEAVCHVWAGMIRGAVSINAYAYHDLGDRAAVYDGTAYTFTSLAALQDFLLLGKRTRLALTKEYEAVLYELKDGNRMFVVVNFTQKPVQVEIKGIPGGDYVEFRGTRRFSSPKAFKLVPHEVVIGTTKKCDEGLATYAETQAMIDAKEKERTGRDNQLLDRYKELSFASSNAKRSSFYKLIDGTRNVWAWEHKYAKDTLFVDFTDPKGVFSFSRLDVYGSGFKDVEAEVRVNGKWIKLKPKSVERDTYRCGLDFGARVTARRFRVLFPLKNPKRPMSVELYEIELPKAKEGLPDYDLGVGPLPAAAKPKASGPRKAVKALWAVDPGTVTEKFKKKIKFDPSYPWVEARFDSFERLDQKKYTGWTAQLAWKDDSKRTLNLIGMVRLGQPGLYTVKIPGLSKPSPGVLRFNDYNQKIGLGCFRNVDRPANCLEATVTGGKSEAAVGDKVEFVLELENPCEDVSLNLLVPVKNRGLQPFVVNGGSTVEMKATGADRCVWKGTLEIRKLAGSAKARSVLAKATTTGGEFELPIFTVIDAAFAQK